MWKREEEEQREGRTEWSDCHWKRRMDREKKPETKQKDEV